MSPKSDIEFTSRKQDFERHDFDAWFSVDKRKIIIDCFDGHCLRCNSSHRLEIDHFYIPKVRGGNFVMCVSDRKSISLNIAVLCHKCNFRKGAKDYKRFHSKAEIIKAFNLQEKLLDWIRADDETIRKIQTYYFISRDAVLGNDAYQRQLRKHGYLSSSSSGPVAEEDDQKSGLNWDTITFTIMMITISIFTLILSHVFFTYLAE